MISKLSVELQSAFRTGITITSLPQCVIELVLNSLDANASRIGVRIDLDKYNLQVVDNGCGIDRAQLELVGERYMTSKCSSLADLDGNAQYYGYRGEAIASLKDACEALVVISKPEGHSSTFSKVMKGGSDINSRVSKAMLNRPGNGTTVAVTNLFYNLPVRRRRMYSAIELEQLRHQMQAIALIHPKVSFTLRDDVTKTVVFNTKKCSNIIENFNQITKLEFPADSFVDVTHSTHPTFKMNGFVCKKTLKSKEHQYIYVNNRLVENRKLYACFNQKLSKSFYFHATKMKSVGSGFSKNLNFDTFKKSPENSTGGDYAIFIINIMCPYKEYDITLEPRKHLVEFKDWDEVLTCLAKSADKFVEHEKLLDNTPLFHEREESCKKTENNNLTLQRKSDKKRETKKSPGAEKVADVHFEKHKRNNVEVGEVDSKNGKEIKMVSAKAIKATSNNESSLVVEGFNDISTDKRIGRGITNVNETSHITPSPDKKMCKGALKRSKMKKEFSAAEEISKNIMNTPSKNVDTSPNRNIDDVIMETNGNDSNCKSKHCKENTEEKSSSTPLKLGKGKSCIKRPLSQGHSEHVITECDYDFSSKLRKRMRMGVVETCNYRTILPIVHAEIYETNLKELKHSLTRLCGGRTRKYDVKHCKIDKSKTRTVVCNSQMKANQYKDSKTSHATSKKQNEVLKKKVVTFFDEACQDEVHSKDALVDNEPRDPFSNRITKKGMNLKKAEIDCIETPFQINNQQPFQKLDNKYLSFNRGENHLPGGKFEENRRLEKRIVANRRIPKDLDFVFQNKSGLRNHKMNSENDSYMIMKNSLKENTIEDLFFSNTAFKRRCAPIECNDQNPSLFNSSRQQDRYDYRKTESYKCSEPYKYDVGDNTCNISPNCCFSYENPLRNVKHCSNKVNASGIGVQKLTHVEFSPDANVFINSYAPRYVSNNYTPKFNVSHDSCEGFRKYSSNAIINPQALEINRDVPENIDGNNKSQIITNGKNVCGNNNKNPIPTAEKNVENCSCTVNEVLSFYKLEHHCCSKQITDKTCRNDESKKLSSSKEVNEVKHISTTYNSLKFDQECSKQNNCKTDNTENRNLEQIFYADDVRIVNDSDKLFACGYESLDKDDCQTSVGNPNLKQDLLDSTYENNTSDDSSNTQYTLDNSILNRKEDFKLSPISSNKNLNNEDMQFSLYFKKRESNTLKIFDCYSQDSSEDSHTSQKANSIQLSHSLDNFRREFIDEFSPVIGNNCDDSRGKIWHNGNQKISGACKVEECIESVDAFEKTNTKEPQNKNVISSSPNRTNFFQFDNFNAKSTITPSKLENSITLSEKRDLNECNTPYEKSLGRSDIPLSFGNSKSQKTFENHDLCECNIPYKKQLATSLKLANEKNAESSDLSDEFVCKSDLKNCLEHSSPPQTNSIFHESTEINSKISAITDEKKIVDGTELSMKLCEIPKILSLNKLISCEEQPPPQSINHLNQSPPQSISTFRESLESSYGIIPNTPENKIEQPPPQSINHLNQSPPQSISIFRESLESSYGIIPNTPENKIEGVTKLNIKLCRTTKISSSNGFEIGREHVSPPQSIFYKSTENNNEVDVVYSSITGEKKIEDEIELRKNSCGEKKIEDEIELRKNSCGEKKIEDEIELRKNSCGEKKIEDEIELRKNSCETVKSPSPSTNNDAFLRMFNVDVKYLASKEKVNYKASVSENIGNHHGSVLNNPGSEGVHTAENAESKPIIGEDTYKYFANATGFTLEYNTDVVKNGSFEKEMDVNEPNQASSKTSGNNSSNSNFLNNLAEAYNFQLTPSSKLKAKSSLGCFHSPKDEEASMEWIEQTLQSGLKVFIHRSTGMSSYEDPHVEHPKAFNTSARNPLLPRGMSPILITPNNCTNEGLPNLTCDQKQNILELAKEQKISTSKEIENNFNEKGKLIDTSMIQLLNNNSRNDMNQEQIGIIQLPFQIASNTSSNCMFSIKHLEDAEVIGLLDNRFIVSIINVSSTEKKKKNVITLFDQHAVDERIRFEGLLNGYRNDDGSFRSSDLTPSVIVTVDHNHMKIIEQFIAKFEFIGLKFTIHDDTLTVTGVPKCLLTRAEKETSSQCKEMLEQGIKNLLHEQIETLLKTGGVVLSSPETLTSIVAYEACRGAIKFGDSISLATAQFLLKKLSQCRTPYQCAHGRPVLAPIIELPPSQ